MNYSYEESCHNNSQPKISVILPLYNAEKYISKTINSILCQSFKDFELIIIDDGSSDGSAEICYKISKKDHRIRIYQQKNGGISKARNKGILEAHGKYIVFCDHDDLMEKEMLSCLYNKISEKDSDIVYSNYLISMIDEDGYCYLKKDAKITDGEYDCNNFFVQIPELRKNLQSVWNGIYKKSIIINSNVRFDESMKFGGEDITFNMMLLPYIRKIVTIPTITYYHFKRKGQSASSYINANRIDSIVRLNDIEFNVLREINNSEINNRTANIVYCCECCANLCLLFSVLLNSDYSIKDKSAYLKNLNLNNSKYLSCTIY